MKTEKQRNHNGRFTSADAGRRKVVITITAGEVNATDVKVKFDFFPNVGEVCTHQGLMQAVVALMELANNKFETP